MSTEKELQQLTFPERIQRVEDMTKDLTTIASQLSHMAVLLTEETEHMHAAAKRFASKRPSNGRKS